MKDHTCRVLKNRHISGRLYLLELSCPGMETPKAGQFLMLKVSKSLDPMGRRAFAVADLREDRLLIFYDVYGRGTYLLSQVREGESLEVFGPLGKGLFNKDGEKHLLIGGGVGLAGLTLLAKELRSEGKRVFIAYGGRTKEHLGMEEWLKEEGFEYELFTEDGSLGRKGKVVEVLKDFDSSWIVHACGPKAMLKALQRIEGYRIYLSLESRMACGWGVCLGCVVKERNGSYVRVCYEGPVFDANRVEL
ncbi:dihydroorotate dehydrogenase electron transfer subunit [Thermocrinis minervae]|uniref:Dihydroorotate dehydrogenase electron transfer subunit n=1 Tax=Thermocrinis minervae TaxID=381751 RepID=A0A1M6RVW6_9AQUI|nr:dihydroorotate dehydrogenase electron transfer subunit [Thermocrinis minervae]SHK36447.1 dihydroorotate dehydrogenase electron transfer subunit [Thermocrinis minervae]